jgi:HEAT repeat protein
VAAFEFGALAGLIAVLGTPVLLGVAVGTWRGIFGKEGREARREAMDRALTEPDVIAKRAKYPVLVVSDAARRGDVSFLISALADPDMRGSAALRLGDLRARQAVPALLRNLRVGNDLDRNAAVRALGEIGDPAAIPGLIEVAKEDEAAGVRAMAIDALANLHEPQGIEMLAAAAIDPQSLITGSTRNLDVPIFRHWKGLNALSKWAANRLRQVEAIEALPVLEGSLDSVGLRRRIRLRRTIRALRRSAKGQA